jgi:UDP-N-acetylmuramoyl-L-alanyl-D-glutamate--2,6-diaminopimelate ligase
MKLTVLLKEIDVLSIHGDASIDIKDITVNSKTVCPGSLFIALKGIHTDGSLYINEAIQRGAVAVVTEKLPSVKENQATFVLVKDARETLAKLAAAFYGYPAKSLNLIGITGTNGKTTVSYLMASILKQAGREPGIIGTIRYQYGEKNIPASLTTPDSCELQRLLREMKDHKVTDVVMEVSSHALVYKRVYGCAFNAAIFTNLSRDHLDFHGSMENYFEAKKQLFVNYLSSKGVAIINWDDDWGKKLITSPLPRFITYGLSSQADIFPKYVHLSLDGIETVVNTPAGRLQVKSSLIGKPNLYNLLAAIAAGVALEIPLAVIKTALEAVAPICGRLERLKGNGIDVIIDYAHTPDALKQVLKTLRPFCQGRLITVFGCGGDRDKGKRPLMGKIASELSDLVIITNDNPRSEPSRQIIQDIEMGINKDKAYCIVPDRRQAIAWAIKHAQKGDMIVIAGKGHEDYQIIGNKRYHFSDREEVLKVIGNR